MSAQEAPRLIATTTVKPGMEAEFEEFVTTVIIPAVRQAKPHLADMWLPLRPAQAQSGYGPRAYVFLFYGDTPLEEWDLAGMFATAYGDEEGARRMRKFDELLETEQTVYSLEGEVLRG